MSKIKRWLAYWRESVAQCQEINDMILYVVFMLAVGVALAGELAGFNISGLGFLADPLIHKVSIVIAILIFVWILIWLPFQRHESEQAKNDAEKKKADDEFKAIKDSKPELELLATFPDNDTTGLCSWRVGVRNKSPNATASQVKVELLGIEPPPRLGGYQHNFHNTADSADMPYPISLEPSDPDGRTIHPGGCIARFNVCAASRYSADIQVTLPYRLMLYADKTAANFSPERIGEKPDSEFKKYSFKLRVSAEGTPPIIKTFSVHFSSDPSQYAVSAI